MAKHSITTQMLKYHFLIQKEFLCKLRVEAAKLGITVNKLITLYIAFAISHLHLLYKKNKKELRSIYERVEDSEDIHIYILSTIYHR